jgi:hypothetical protein
VNKKHRALKETHLIRSRKRVGQTEPKPLSTIWRELTGDFAIQGEFAMNSNMDSRAIAF